MVKVRNLTNSPFDLHGAEGMVRLPAFGEVEGEFTDDYLGILESSMAVEVIKDEDAKTGDGGEAKPEDELTKLRADYLDVVGKRAFHGWTAAQLQEKIDAKLAS